MLVTNTTNQDYWFGPLHLAAGVNQTLTVDDTTETSLYLTSDVVADALNNAYLAGKITVSGQAQPFPRPTGTPALLHGDGSPEGVVFAPQGSVYMRRDNTGSTSSLYAKTTGVTISTGWEAVGADTQVAPSGIIQMYGGAAAPEGWLLCDGSAVSRTLYDALFGVIGTHYGAGDGSSTFNVPDLRGRVGVGYAASGGHADVSTLGGNDGVALAHRRSKHRHTINDPGHSNGVPTSSGGTGSFLLGTGNLSNVYPGPTIASNSATTGVTVGSDVANDPLDSPAYLVVNHIIKA